jgi:hypothetical protein
MGKIKRKPRTKLIKKMDITKPITLEMLGSSEDPCFGKLHDSREPACQRCGDNEICAIAMGQLNHLKRAEVEANQKFKDLEEKNIKPTVDIKVIKKSIKKRIREIIKMASTKGIPKDEIIHDIFASYSKDGITKKTISNLIDRVEAKSDNITLKNNRYTWSK